MKTPALLLAGMTLVSLSATQSHAQQYTPTDGGPAEIAMENPALQWCDNTMGELALAADRAEEAQAIGDNAGAAATLMQGLQSASAAARPYRTSIYTASAIFRGISLGNALTAAVASDANGSKLVVNFLAKYYLFIQNESYKTDQYRYGLLQEESIFRDYITAQLESVSDTLIEYSRGVVFPLGNPKGYTTVMTLALQFAIQDLSSMLTAARNACQIVQLQSIQNELLAFNALPEHDARGVTKDYYMVLQRVNARVQATISAIDTGCYYRGPRF